MTVVLSQVGGASRVRFASPGAPVIPCMPWGAITPWVIASRYLTVAGCGWAGSGEQGEGLNVSRPYHSEVPPVEGGDFSDAHALGDGDD
jgi:hypothetical protein